jgi:signal recognition particle subunit SRP19
LAGASLRADAWPTCAHVQALTGCAARFQVYLDAKKTLADGRKLPAKQCVEYPTMQEMKEVIEHLGFEAGYEEKAYPRDLTQFGRFRVLLKDPATGEPKVEGVATRRQLLQKIAELIPNLKSRREGKLPKPGVPGLALPGYAETLMPIAAAQAPQMNPGGSSAAGAGSSKKKNKGRDKQKE